MLCTNNVVLNFYGKDCEEFDQIQLFLQNHQIIKLLLKLNETKTLIRNYK